MLAFSFTDNVFQQEILVKLNDLSVNSFIDLIYQYIWTLTLFLRKNHETAPG